MIRGEKIETIEWKQYDGETVNTNLIIRNGQKIQETDYYKDRVKAVPRGNAYIIGNGPSRKNFDLNTLSATGQTYGCNALYRDFVPDFIFSIDLHSIIDSLILFNLYNTKALSTFCNSSDGFSFNMLTISLYALDFARSSSCSLQIS